MSEVEKVALWVGLISSIASIVLSIVAIAFAILVNQRSERVSDQTLKSLQKIESTVERLSSDTTGLIKGAWDKMLGGFGAPQEPARERPAVKELASGLADEVRTELGLSDQPHRAGTSPELVERVEKALQNLEESIRSQLASSQPRSTYNSAYSVYRSLRRLSVEARELAVAIRGYHLTRDEYKALSDGPLAGAMRELRRNGMLVPLRDPDKKLVYWFPSDRAEQIRVNAQLVRGSASGARERVREELGRVGYVIRDES